jgi:hypothetical protein
MRVELTPPPQFAPLEFALSPNGRYIVFVASVDGRRRLWLRPLNVIALTERDDARERLFALTRERRDVDTRITRLVRVLETTGDIESVATTLRDLEARRATLDADLRALQPLPRLAPAVIESRLAEWRRLLRASVTQGRAVL